MVRRGITRSRAGNRRSGVSPLCSGTYAGIAANNAARRRVYGGRDRSRRGIALLELVVAGAVLGTLMLVCLQLLAATAAQRRTADQRQLAVIELGNVLERLTARPWAELTPEMAAPQLPPSVRDRLPGAELKIEVTAPSAEPNAKRIVVSLRWQNNVGEFTSPVKITTWRWKDQGLGIRDEGRGTRY